MAPIGVRPCLALVHHVLVLAVLHGKVLELGAAFRAFKILACARIHHACRNDTSLMLVFVSRSAHCLSATAHVLHRDCYGRRYLLALAHLLHRDCYDPRHRPALLTHRIEIVSV